MTNNTLSQFSLGEILTTDYPTTEWLVNGLIPNQGITCITGKPGVGKSFLTLYLAQMIASGESFLGQFATTQKSVCVITKEDPRRLIQKRLKLLQFDESLPVSFSDDMNAFCNSEEHLTMIEDLLARTQSEVLIIDSFIRVVGGDENLSKDVTKVHEVLKRLTQQGVTVIFTHHQGKEDAGKAGIDKPRGSSDIGAMVDSLLNFSKRDDLITVDHAKSRWDESMGTFVVKFPSFEGDDNSFHFLGYLDKTSKDSEPTSTEQAMDDILEIVRNSSEPIHQADIIRRLEENGATYSAGTTKIALDRMDGVQLSSYKDCGRRYFSLKNQPEQVSNQSSNEVVQLPEARDAFDEEVA